MEYIKLNPIKSLISYFTFNLLFVGFLYAQDCEVLKESISETYEGDCKKGKAQGKGTAKGEDSYTGEFKKGLPHGYGIYTWGNGNVYEGDFKNGSMNGKGEMTISLESNADSVVTGFWKEDKYLGKYKDVYKEHSRSANVLSLRVSKVKNPSEKDKNTLLITINEKGQAVFTPNISINPIYGNHGTILPSSRAIKVEVLSFPFKFTLSYRGQNVEMEVYQAGTYNVLLDFNL
jgi:hypothetical protein